MIVLKVFFWLSVFFIFWANIGYQLSLIALNKILKIKKLKKNYKYQPTVTIMIVAHNEEKVIKEKLINVLNIDYPVEKTEILVSSDNSTDKTNEIVKNIINLYPNRNIRLYEVKERKGKTNAQNEAARTVTSEILIMTDANSILEKNAIKELTSSFTDDDIVYVTGKLCYTNSNNNNVSKSESTYWDLDIKIRDIESRLQTITAGNGALYACKTREYVEFEPIKGHDISMPVYYALKNKKAIANHDAVVYEKAGENIEDEFKRKVRMNRRILLSILPNIKILNIFKYKWFTYFYLGHRTCRYLLWFMHSIALLTSSILMNYNYIYFIPFIIQLVCYFIAIFEHFYKGKNKIFNFIYYYCMTLVAQLVGVKNTVMGKDKPFWEKAESTR